MYIVRDRQPQGTKFYVNRNFFSFRSFVASLKKNLFEVWFYTIVFHDLIHKCSPEAGADNPKKEKKNDVNRKALSLYHLLQDSKKSLLKYKIRNEIL